MPFIIIHPRGDRSLIKIDRIQDSEKAHCHYEGHAIVIKDLFSEFELAYTTCLKLAQDLKLKYELNDEGLDSQWIKK